MADEDKTSEREDDKKTEPETTPEPERKDEVPPEVKAALKKANKEAETLRLKLKEYEDRDKTESEKLTEARAAAERDAAEARSNYLRLKVGMAKGLSSTLAERLKGDTEEEMAADADSLLGALKSKGNGAGSFDGGARQSAPASNSWLAEAIRNRR